MSIHEYAVIEGRRPAGLIAPRPRPLASPLGDYFARAAYFEAASAVAFERLVIELDAHDAPSALVQASERAREAELRHALALESLAERFDVEPYKRTASRGGVRPLLDVASDNAVEGVVRETYGAAVARFRSRNARDPRIRAVMIGIAEDECEKADLAFRVATWLHSMLDPIEAAIVEDSVRHAARSLAHEIDRETDEALVAAAGVPSRRDATAIWSGLSHRVWHGLSEHVWRSAA